MAFANFLFLLFYHYSQSISTVENRLTKKYAKFKLIITLLFHKPALNMVTYIMKGKKNNLKLHFKSKKNKAVKLLIFFYLNATSYSSYHCKI